MKDLIDKGLLDEFLSGLKSLFAARSHTHAAGDVLFSAGSGSSGSLSPTHMGAMGLGRCLTAFMPPEAVTIEYSTDGGATWADYGADDHAKRKIFAASSSSENVLLVGGPSAAGAAGEMTRVTVEPADGRYGRAECAYAWVSTNGAGNVLCDVECSTVGAKDAWSTVVEGFEMSGWGGPNALDLPALTFGGHADQTRNAYGYRFTFSCRSYVAGRVAKIGEIGLYGPAPWTPANNMMKYGRLYSWDVDQNAAFPAKVQASQFVGPLQGTAESARSVPWSGVTGKAVATQSADGLMSAADKAKLDGLSDSGGDDELVLALLSDTRELEDLTIRTGSFANAGEGWNTFAFPEPFDAPPLVVARCEGYGVDVKGVTADRFLYMVTQATSSGASSRTLYAANSGGVVYATKPTASSTAFTVLTSAGSSGTEGTADAVTVRWAAFEKGE